MIITNIVIILIITIWNLYHCYGMMIYGDSFAEATKFFGRLKLLIVLLHYQSLIFMLLFENLLRNSIKLRASKF